MANYSVTVLEIGAKTVDGSFYFGDFMPAEKEFPNPFSMTLLRGEGMTILIDTGVDVGDPVKQEIIKAAGVGNVHGPAEVLATAGVKPEEVDAVILTHAHFDHAGALDCYPNAQFYLQRAELNGWQMAASHTKYAALHIFSMDLNDVRRLEALEAEGRLTLLDGDAELFPGVRVINVGSGHSFGSQMVLIETAKGRFLHAGDACNRPENLTGTDAFPFYLPNTKFGVGAVTDILRGYDTILRLCGGDITRVIMTHDDTRREHYPNRQSALGLTIFEIA